MSITFNSTCEMLRMMHGHTNHYVNVSSSDESVRFSCQYISPDWGLVSTVTLSQSLTGLVGISPKGRKQRRRVKACEEHGHV